MTQLKFVEDTLQTMFTYIGIDPDCEINAHEDAIDVVIVGNNLNFLIGMHGLSLQALENFLNTASYKNFSDGVHINVDVNEYKLKKREKIEDMAKRGIDKVRFFGEEITLPTMTPAERRIVHTFVAEYDDIATESVGEEPMRRVVLKKKI